VKVGYECEGVEKERAYISSTVRTAKRVAAGSVWLG